MAQPVFYQTVNNMGVDPTVYSAVSASVTPETPAPPFLVGTRAFGSDGSEFIYVQASTSISLTDFVVLDMGAGAGNDAYQANSITNTNVASSLAVGVASTGLVLRQSVTFIPAGAFFWACTKGQNIPATTSGGTGGLATNAPGVVLFTSATAGILTSVTTSQTLAAAFAGIICVNSLTVSIPASVIPPAGGTLSSTGFTVGPVVNMNNPRLTVLSSLTLGNGSLNAYSF